MTVKKSIKFYFENTWDNDVFYTAADADARDYIKLYCHAPYKKDDLPQQKLSQG